MSSGKFWRKTCCSPRLAASIRHQNHCRNPQKRRFPQRTAKPTNRCPQPGLNRRPLPYQGSALPAELRGRAPKIGAGEGNRTLTSSLEGLRSTIELHPPNGGCRSNSKLVFVGVVWQIILFMAISGGKSSAGGVEGAGFEPAKAEPPDLQSGPFDRSGIPPKFSIIS